jgi:hypothetical protein
MKTDDIVNEIKREINDDPTIHGAAHILVFSCKTGIWPFQKSDIRVGGIVHSESDKKKAEEHAKHAAGDLPVVNEIEVVPKK